MPRIQDVIQALEQLAPRSYQESYDNAGLIVGNPSQEISGVLFSLDATEAVLEEAKAQNCNLIVSHHPIVFRGLKQLQGRNYVERTVIKAIKEDIALYAIHTNLDNVQGGVNTWIAQKLKLENIQILVPKSQTLQKMIAFVPQDHTAKVLEALGNAGAGQIGDYKNCSFRSEGIGTFQPSEKTQPFIGEPGKQEEVKEDRIELIFPSPSQNKILKALKQAHPYEEVAYYIHQVENKNQDVGSGAIGDLPEPMSEKDFLSYLKDTMDLEVIRYTELQGQSVKRVALCGGAGSFLLPAAIAQGAQFFVSADFKYHEFFDADGHLVIADIGHYESERFTQDLLDKYLEKELPELKRYRSKVNTNPVRYHY